MDLAYFETAEGPVAAQAEVVAEFVKMDEEMDLKTAVGSAAGRTSQGAAGGIPAHVCGVRAHAAEEEWLVQYFVEYDRASEASMFLAASSGVLRFVCASLIAFSTDCRRHGNGILSVGGLRRGRKTLNICFTIFLCFALMPDCGSSLDGEVSGQRDCTSECACLLSRMRD